jgi:hypothetical protein
MRKVVVIPMAAALALVWSGEGAAFRDYSPTPGPFVGKTDQGERITFKVSRSKRKATDVRFGVALRCTDGSTRHETIALDRWRLSGDSAVLEGGSLKVSLDIDVHARMAGGELSVSRGFDTAGNPVSIVGETEAGEDEEIGVLCWAGNAIPARGPRVHWLAHHR